VFAFSLRYLHLLPARNSEGSHLSASSAHSCLSRFTIVPAGLRARCVCRYG
jgi:hypothetical protein